MDIVPEAAFGCSSYEHKPQTYERQMFFVVHRNDPTQMMAANNGRLCVFHSIESAYAFIHQHADSYRYTVVSAPRPSL